MSDEQNHSTPPADATRLAGEAYGAQIKTDGTRVAGAGYQSILATQLGQLPADDPTERHEIGDRIGGQFEVLAIHRGSMGVVYGTFDHTTQLPRALKTLQERFAANTKMRELFAEEAATWVQLGKHPFVVRAYSVKKFDGRPHVITEYVRGELGMGGDLHAWLGHKRLTLKLALEMALQIAQGMQHAVRTIPGLVHRDLKPANILVDSRGRAMVTDFGLVCAAEVEAGTPAYMAPEQWRGESLDARTDIYAYGCILYEMFTGHRMFTAETVDQWKSAHRMGLPVAPRILDPDLPVQIEAVVIKCLAKIPEERPQNWDEVVTELAALFHRLTGQPAVLDFSAFELTADELLTASYSLGQLGKYAEMLLACDRALELAPNDARILVNKSSALAHLKRHEEAIACCDCALVINPKSAAAYYNKGNSLLHLSRYEEAIACCDRALAIDPSIDPVNKGCALDALKRYEEAIGCYDRALTVDPDDALALYNKGNSLFHLSRYDEAIACFDRTLAIDPNKASAWCNKGFVLNVLKRYEEAIVCFDRGLIISPNHADFHYNKGNSFFHLKRHEEAVTCYDRALEINPNAESARNRRNIAIQMNKQLNSDATSRSLTKVSGSY